MAFEQGFLAWLSGDRQAHEHRHCIVTVRRWRVAAAIFDMTALAGVGVKQRAKAVSGTDSRGGDQPGVTEEAVTNAKVQPSAWRDIGGRQGEGVMVGLGDGADTGG